MKKLFLMAPLAAVMFAAAPAMADKGKMSFEDKWEKLDTNNSGFVTREELRSKADEKFSKMDRDSDGQVTEAEFKTAMEEHKREWKEKKKDDSATY